MSRQRKFRLYINNRPATREQLDRVESIVVEQEMDMVWEAQLTIPVCLDRQGRWRDADESMLQPDVRIRVEIAVQNDEFIPLIDGPVVGIDSRLQFEPGQSAVTLIVHDDSIYLQQDEEHFSHDDRSDFEIIQEIIQNCEHISRPEIDDDLRDNGGETLPLRFNGTAMQLLRGLAKVHNKHVYVLPGSDPGESVGCCKALPTAASRESRLAPLILLGSEANCRELNTGLDLGHPSDFTTATVQSTDKSVSTGSGSFRDSESLGERPALPEGRPGGRRILRPSPFEGRRPELAAAARAQKSSYALQLSGSVIEGCYQDVLLPYHLVTLQAGETPQSGDYVVRQVTHTLGRSTYSQSFFLMRNATSETGGADPLETTRSPF